MSRFLKINDFCKATLNKLSCVVSGFGIAFEQPHKRAEITYFCMPKTIEALWNFLEKRNVVRTLPNQEVSYNPSLHAIDHYFRSGPWSQGQQGLEKESPYRTYTKR